MSQGLEKENVSAGRTILRERKFNHILVLALIATVPITSPGITVETAARREGRLLEETRREGTLLEETRREGTLLEETRREGRLLEETRREGTLLEETRREGTLLEAGRDKAESSPSVSFRISCKCTGALSRRFSTQVLQHP